MRHAIQQPDGRLLFVPVRSTDCGAVTLRTGRLASGERIGLAFTSEAALVATLGAGQPWVNLAEPLVPGMFAEPGVTETRIDPLPVTAEARETAVAADAFFGASSGMESAAAASVRTLPVPQRRRVRVWPSRRPARRPVRHAAHHAAVRHAY